MTEHTSNLTHADLMTMSQSELDDLYRGIDSPGQIPVGTTEGTAVLLPGRRFGAPLRRIAGLLLWKGKIFSPESSDLQNRISPFGFRAIRARVYAGESWMDDHEAIILDYSTTSFVARWIRDEIREVAPGLWLGKVFVRKWHALDFTLAA